MTPDEQAKVDRQIEIVKTHYQRRTETLTARIAELEAQVSPLLAERDEAQRAFAQERQEHNATTRRAERIEVERDHYRDQSEQRAADCRLLLWLHAEAVWQRGEQERHATNRAVKYVEIADKYDSARARVGALEATLEELTLTDAEREEISRQRWQWGVRWPDSQWINQLSEAEARTEATRHAATGAVLVRRASEYDLWMDVGSESLDRRDGESMEEWARRLGRRPATGAELAMGHADANGMYTPAPAPRCDGFGNNSSMPER